MLKLSLNTKFVELFHFLECICFQLVFLFMSICADEAERVNKDPPVSSS